MTVENYSISKRLRREGKITEEFEFLLSNMTLEEIIGLKLEVSSRAINHKLYGFKLFDNITKICRDALLIYALSAARTKNEAALFLGMENMNFRKSLKKFNIDI